MQQDKPSQLVRDYVQRTYIEEARRKSQSVFRVVTGDVHRALRFKNRVPSVCQALTSQGFLEENGLDLIDQTGPPSGLSTTVTYTYRFRVPNRGTPLPDSGAQFRHLRGIAKEVFRSLGGGESFIRGERDQFEGRR